MTPDQIFDRLAQIARSIEEHRAAAYMLDIERMALQGELRRAGWKPPKVLTE